MTDENPFVNLENARLLEQTEVMETILNSGECPFCPENLEKYHKPPIILHGSHWVLTENQWPYRNTRVHLLAIHRRHVEKLLDLDSEDWSSLGVLMAWAENHFKIVGGGMVMRFGNPAHNGGTVRHLHAQLLVAEITDKKNERYTPVRIKIG